ncbi:MAG: hypothetical protein ACFFAN_06495 [Promethearchaeota archaeon]
MPFTKEDVEILAYRRYKSKESYEKSVWYLAELCCVINKNIKNSNSIQPLETDNLVLLLKENVDGEILTADEKEIKDLAEIIYKEHPEKSKLHWFIAEKTLLLEEIKNIISKSEKK